MTGILQGLLSSIGAATDEYFEYVTMLLPGNGTNGAQNNTFLDSSSNNFTITRNGNTTQGTFAPYGSNWSNYFDGSGDYLTFPNNTAFAFGTGAFTIEFWVNSSGLNDSFILSGRAGIGTLHITYGGFGGTTPGCLRYVGSSTITSGSVLISNNLWNHCAIVRDGSNNITLYVNGVSAGTGTDTTNYTTTSGTWYINSNDSGPTPGGAGYISNLRIIKGTAVYTGAFTPSTSPLTAITNTSLLTCQSNRFIDNSTNAFTITRNGDTSVQRFSPFAPTAPYAAGTDGGSGYFDGTGDYLTTSTTQIIPTGSFTVECWAYVTGSGTNQKFVSQGSSGSAGRFSMGIEGGNWFTQLAGDLIQTGTPVRNQWNYIAVTYNGSTITMYVNGTSIGTVASSANAQNSALTIGQDWNTYTTTGYIADVRISNTVRTISVPTAPYTSDGNTRFLASFTNAGIIDNAEMNNLETVGNAQISTTQSKFGGGSMLFDGSGDYLTLHNVLTSNLGSGPFTVELWVYFNSASGTQFILSNYQSVTVGWGLGISSGNFAFWATGDTPDISTSVAPSTGVWYHLAVSGQSGAIRMFLNGTQIGSTFTGTPALDSTATLRIGDGQGAASPQAFNGYIDDLRITKGYARYTTSFTPQRSQWQDQ